jgi:hypothetical protein
MISRGKYRFAGIPMHSRKGLENLRFSLLSPALEFLLMVYLKCRLINPPRYKAGSADQTRTSRFSLASGSYHLFREITFPLLISTLASNLDFQNAQLDMPAKRGALTIPARFTVAGKKAEKMSRFSAWQMWFSPVIGRTGPPYGARHLRSVREYRLRRDSTSDKMRVIPNE